MNAHIINCYENDFFNDFLPNGYLGVGFIINGVTSKKLEWACRNSYSMYADMKTIREGDIVFVHAGNNIYGAFKAASEFLEDPNTPHHFLSRNVHYYPYPNNPQSGWQNNINNIPNLGYSRRIGITHFADNQGINRCFEEGINSTEVFELKFKKKIWSTPERWKYTDTKRIVRPLMEDEAYELLKLIEIRNSDNPNYRNVTPANLSHYIPIEFVLNPNIIENEKIIEGWILENIGRNQILDAAMGYISSFGNNMPTGYLKFMDIFGYQYLDIGDRKFKVIEVKKNVCEFPNDINQLIGYIDWVVENLAYGNHKIVEGILVARNFNNDCVDFVTNFNTIGRIIRLISFDYDPPNYNTLNIQRVA